jgi:hypothetical protein
MLSEAVHRPFRPEGVLVWTSLSSLSHACSLPCILSRLLVPHPMISVAAENSRIERRFLLVKHVSAKSRSYCRQSKFCSSNENFLFLYSSPKRVALLHGTIVEIFAHRIPVFRKSSKRTYVSGRSRCTDRCGIRVSCDEERCGRGGIARLDGRSVPRVLYRIARIPSTISGGSYQETI